MAMAEQELWAAQHQMLFRSVNDRIMDAGEALGHSTDELEFACECADETCFERIRLAPQRFLAITSDANRFIVLRGHEWPDVEDTVAQRDGFLIVAKRGAGAQFVKNHS